MVFQPFNYIANRLAYFLSYLYPRNPLWRIRISLGNFLSGLGRYRRYQSLTEEQKWWDESTRTRAFFASSDARYGRVSGSGISAHGCLSPIPLITSYVPRLLPAYRDHSRRRVDDATCERELTPSIYQKWHRLVYPHENLPSRREATKTIRYLSTRDRQEIARIARLVTDEAAAQKGFSPSPVYQNLWTSWLQCKGPDLTIVFE